MCDPISIGLTLAGSAISAYGQSQVGRARNRDIAEAGQKYDAERLKQQGLTGENEQTVGKTLGIYSPTNQANKMAEATDARSKAYVAPIQSRDVTPAAPKDFDANNVIGARNLLTGTQAQAQSISEALAKAKLDAYGDVQTGSRIGANENNQAIDMVRRIQKSSADAAGQQQAVLPYKLQADQGAGATAGAIGDVLTMAGSLYGLNAATSGLNPGGGVIPASQYSTNLGSITPPMGSGLKMPINLGSLTGNTGTLRYGPNFAGFNLPTF